MVVVLLFIVAIAVIGLLYLFIKGAEQQKNSTKIDYVIGVANSLEAENTRLTQQNAELRKLVLEYKVRLEAKELGLPFPTVEGEEEAVQNVLRELEKAYIKEKETPSGS